MGRGLDRIGQAVDAALASGSYRIRGVVEIDGPVISWEGIVVGRDEQYLIETNGLRMDSRRVDGVHWARRLDPDGPWTTVPPDGPMDLAALLQGSDVRSQALDDGWLISLRFHDLDILEALTHVPSAGPTDAEVTLTDGTISQVALDLAGGARAAIALWDYGATLAVTPVASYRLGES
jgi:hypothetical protein